MFAPISAIFSLLFFPATLPNGIRLVELPAEDNSIQIVAGYTAGGLKELASTAAAKEILFKAYAVGGTVEFITELDRTALRIRAPKWSLPMLADQLPELFKDLPKKRDEGSDPSSPDFRARVEEEIRSALLGQVSDETEYATGDAFVLISAPVSNALRDALAAIPKRGAASRPEEQINRLAAERTLRFKPDLPAGAVIFASPIPGVYYKQWYSVLLLDRLIHRIVPLGLKTSLPLTVRPHYYRLELTVPAGQFAETAEENLLQELQRLQFSRADARELSAAQQETLAYLNGNEAREWFASHDLAERRDEGAQWVQSMTADDMRVAARDLLIMNRVIASWSPKVRQASVEVESLSTASSPSLPQPSPPGRGTSGEAAARSASPVGRSIEESEGKRAEFPNHADPVPLPPPPERLSSGVSIIQSTTNAVFIAGGALTPGITDPTPFTKFRADRILVLASPESMDRARQLWSAFKGGTTGDIGVPKGKVSSGDLGALFVLKTILDLRIIQSGWWNDVQLRIDASQGSDLEIRTSDEAKRSQILEWIKAIAAAPPSDASFAWSREVAIHHFSSALPGLQALTFERDPQGGIPDLQTITPKHVQDVARIYF